MLTLAIEPVRKYSSVDCISAIVNADRKVPSRFCTPPNTTTMNVSTIYACPAVGPVAPSIVNELPATPASPEPSAKVSASTLLVLMPAAPLMTRFCVTARMLQAPATLEQEQEHRDRDDGRQSDQEHPVERYLNDRRDLIGTRQPLRKRDGDFARAEQRPKPLLHDEAQAPCREQRVERTVVEKSNETPLERGSRR